jgi:hypothetical protein
MTVTLSKRLFEGDATTASLTSPTPASKKMRVSAPLSEHLSASALSKPGSASLGPLNQQHHSSARKRRHDAASEHTNAAASPSNVGKRVSYQFHSPFLRLSVKQLHLVVLPWSNHRQYAFSSRTTCTNTAALLDPLIWTKPLSSMQLHAPSCSCSCQGATASGQHYSSLCCDLVCRFSQPFELESRCTSFYVCFRQPQMKRHKRYFNGLNDTAATGI